MNLHYGRLCELETKICTGLHFREFAWGYLPTLQARDNINFLQTTTTTQQLQSSTSTNLPSSSIPSSTKQPSSPSLFPIPPRASPSKNLAASNQIAHMSSDEFANMTDNFTPFPNSNLQALWQELALQITQENIKIVIADMVFRGLSQADLRSILEAYWQVAQPCRHFNC